MLLFMPLVLESGMINIVLGHEMAIFTASQATTAVQQLVSTTAAQAYANLIANYQGIFDLIAEQSQLGLVSITWSMSLTDYNLIQPVLVANGYTVSTWPSGLTGTTHSTVTISWPSAPVQVTSYPQISQITPASISGTQNVYFSAVFQAVGGTAPYTYTITGTIPQGLAWSTLTNVSQITLSGTPTQAGVEYSGFTITARDANAQTASQTVNWEILLSTQLTVATQSAGAESLVYTPSTGVLSFTPYLLPTSTTTTLGGVKIDNTSITVNGQGQIQYQLPTSTTTTLGAVRVDGTSIQAQSGVISLVQTTLDTRIRAISAAFSVAMT